MQIPAPSLLIWSQKDFSDKFYTILTSPEMTDWLLKQKILFGTSIFLYDERVQPAMLE